MKIEELKVWKWLSEMKVGMIYPRDLVIKEICDDMLTVAEEIKCINTRLDRLEENEDTQRR